MRILISGPVGSGKTTQSNLLSDNLKVPVIDCGNILRDLAQGIGPEAKEVKQAMNTGTMVSDEIAARVVEERLKSLNPTNGFIMDGYPRSIDQLKYFDPEFDRVFYLDIPDSEVFNRLKTRGRVDDQPEIIKKRLELYHQLTESVLSFYQDKGILVKIDGTKSIDEVQTKIREALSNTGRK